MYPLLKKGNYTETARLHRVHSPMQKLGKGYVKSVRWYAGLDSVQQAVTPHPSHMLHQHASLAIAVGLAHVTCFDQWKTSKGQKYACPLGLASCTSA